MPFPVQAKTADSDEGIQIVKDLRSSTTKLKITWKESKLSKDATQAYGFPPLKSKVKEHKTFPTEPGDIYKYSTTFQGEKFELVVFTEKYLDKSIPGIDTSSSYERSGKILFKLFQIDGDNKKLISDDQKTLKGLEGAIDSAEHKRWLESDQTKAGLEYVTIAHHADKMIRVVDLITIFRGYVTANQLLMADKYRPAELSAKAKRAIKNYRASVEKNIRCSDSFLSITHFQRDLGFEKIISILEQLPPETPLAVVGIINIIKTQVGRLTEDDALTYYYDSVMADLKKFFSMVASENVKLPLLK